MKKNEQHLEILVRLSLLLLVAVSTLINDQMKDVTRYVVILLVFMLNTQLRIIFSRHKLFLFSLFLDIVILYFLIMQFNSYNYLLLFITLFHSLLFLKEERIPITLIILGTFIYFLKQKSMEAIVLCASIYILLCIAIPVIRHLTEKVSNIELLYDQNRKYSYELENTKKRLEDYSRMIENISQLEERNRISREIHDTVGHKLTGVLMQTEASIKILDIDETKGREMLHASTENLRECIDLLRHTVRNMKPKEYSSRILSIKQMVEDFSKTSGIPIDFSVLGTLVKLPPSMEITLYKNIQEAITNAARHGNPQSITVKLEYTSDEVISTVQDDGKGCLQLIKGMGINGMDERAALLGGKIVIHSNEGFCIQTILPLKNSLL